MLRKHNVQRRVSVQPFDLEGKALELVYGAIHLGPRRGPIVAVRLGSTPTQFLQVLEYTQCDGVPVRVAGGAQE